MKPFLSFIGLENKYSFPLPPHVWLQIIDDCTTALGHLLASGLQNLMKRPVAALFTLSRELSQIVEG